MKKLERLIGAALIASTLIGCGGGDGPAAGGPSQAPGTLLETSLRASHTAPDIEALRATSPLAGSADPAACGVDIRHIVYVTLDPQGQPATASAAVMVPTGAGANCSGAHPLLLYAHGTTVLKSYDMADPAHNDEALAIETFFASQGYIVIAPNYLGYDVSSLDYHPYLNADVQAGDMIDGLTAGIAALGGTPTSGLYVAGYSQGGHVAMATQRALERDHAAQYPLTASFPMSGPYDLVQFSDDVTLPDGAVNIGATLFMPFLLTSYQNAYGNVYGQPSDAYQSPFDRTSPTLFPTDTPLDTLIANGELPADDPTFTRLFGTGGLITDGFRAAYPGSAFRDDLSRNTLLGWNPKAPTALCGGMNDPTVYFSNAGSARDDFATRGVTVPVWDVETRSTLPAGSSYTEIHDSFRIAKAAAGANWQTKYHGELVPPACYALARGFFAAHGAGQ
jgi:hypothetical protein